MSVDDVTAAEVAAGLREFFADHPSLAAIRAGMDDPGLPAWDVGVWAKLAGQLGVAGLTAPEEHAGLGLGASAAAAAAYEAGVGLYPGPLRSALIAGYLLSRCQDPSVVGESLRGIATGELTVAVAIERSDVSATDAGDAVSGTAHALCDAPDAALVVVPIGDDVVAVVRRDSAGVSVHRRRSTDPSHHYGDVILDGAPATVVRFDTGVLETVLDVAQLIVAAEQAGGTAGCLFMAADYARTREQFGAYIATFQAISHRLAELAVDLESLRALIYSSTGSADAGDHRRVRALAPLVRAQAGEVFCVAADTLIQVHGGIGFTWEHGAHLYFRRAHTMRDWAGCPADLRDEAMRHGAVDLVPH